MSDDMLDVRTKLCPRTHAVLTAISKANGKELAELLREITDEWAEHKVHEATLVQRLIRGEGGSVEPKGG